jgi:hypothetical protein
MNCERLIGLVGADQVSAIQAPKRMMTVLHLPPAITPRKAVKASNRIGLREQCNAES